MSYEEKIWAGVPPKNTRMWTVPIGAHTPQSGCHVEKSAAKVLLRITVGDG